MRRATMGAYMDKPKTTKDTYSGSGSRLKFSVTSMQGWRSSMEDGDIAVVGLPGMREDKDKVNEKKDHEAAWFGVFDGHAGGTIADKARGKLLKCIQDTNHFNQYIRNQQNITKEEFTQGMKKGIQEGFLSFDEKMLDLLSSSYEADHSGSTAVCALVTSKYIVFANCGDSRGVCCSKGAPGLVTLDHKPNDQMEKDRIEAAGGKVIMDRVNGSLAVARALGDFEFKKMEGKGAREQMVSPEPEIFVKEIEPEDEFIVLACDGVWDVMDNQEICDYVTARLKVTDDLEVITEEILDTCLYRDSRDNMTIILITLPGAPKPDLEAKKADDELNTLLEKKVIDLLASEEEPPSLADFNKRLAEENIEGFPPGGGISSKRALINKFYHKYIPEKDDDLEDEDEDTSSDEDENYWDK